MSTPPARHITIPKGFYAAATTCGLKESGWPDLALILSDRQCSTAGVFSTSRTPGAPLIVSKRHLRGGRAWGVIVNSGNANDCTGDQGVRDAKEMCRLVAANLPHAGVPALQSSGIDAGDVLVGSTGIIGRLLDMEKVTAGVETLLPRLARGREADAAAARAILTTDLTLKTARRRFTLDGQTVNLGGIAKGSGMIAPNMGTMLAYITTDAAITATMLQRALRDACAASFNRISVDQHTSPSDMVLVFANGAAGNASINDGGEAYNAFADALTDLCRDLAYQVVKDGEGATRVFRVRITGARSEREADRVAQAIVNSPLVKTAVHGADANWGRIVTAAGYSGVALRPTKLSLHIGADNPICVFAQGMPTALRRAELRRLATLMRKKEVTFQLELGRGAAQVEWLGCDLSREYVTINADYTT
ncbi:MAG: bifunctional glutamate N-acetyltransferase/amino-acid acetyltransferase ArgJ [Phycisphaeraceae bacterium]